MNFSVYITERKTPCYKDSFESYRKCFVDNLNVQEVLIKGLCAANFKDMRACTTAVDTACNIQLTEGDVFLGMWKGLCEQ
jgi:hypothetical protein